LFSAVLFYMLSAFLVRKAIWRLDMSNFENFIARHGECGVQAILEQIERCEAVWPAVGSSVEERWKILVEAGPRTDFRVARS
jgi:hypothetical protein